MTTIVTRAGKGSALTHNEVDANFTNLQTSVDDAELAAIAGLTSAADKGIMFTGSGTAAVFTLTAAGLALLDAAAASNQRTTLGLGTSATMDEATDAQVRAATADKVITAELIESASAFVALTSSGGSIAIDWDSGINFSHTFTENTIFANPTNGQPGTWRTIRTTQHASSPKTIGVGTQYHSTDAEAISTTATNDAVDHYTIMCITSSLFVIFQSLNISDVP